MAVASRPDVKATASHQGMPPREAYAFEAMHAPPLPFIATGDSLLAADPHVTPTHERSNLETFHATLADATVGHLYPWTWTPSAWRR